MQRIFFTALFLLIPTAAFAASVFVDGVPDISTKGTSIISVRIDTEGIILNAIEGTISLSNGAHIVDVRDTSSIIAFWIEPLEVQNGVVHLSGIIPGGFNGEGELLSLVVAGDIEGSASLDLGPFTVFQDDGLGTEESVPSHSVSLDVVEGLAGETGRDSIPPEPFSIGVINVSGDSEAPIYAAIFATNDRQTGIDRYEIQETDMKEPDSVSWHAAESPYVLSDQTRTHKIFVRAFDNAGNTREAQFREEGKQGMMGMLLIIGLLFLCLLVYAWRRFFSKTKR